MNVNMFSGRVDSESAENSWLNLLLILFVMPLFWLLFGYWLGQHIIQIWLVVMLAYVVALLICGNSNVSGRETSGRVFRISKAAIVVLAPLFWGGILATPYWFLYMFFFDRANFLPR
jgi:hypothetical protein